MTSATAPRNTGVTPEAALAQIAAGAGEADAGARGLAPDMALLSASGLMAHLTDDEVAPNAQAVVLRRIGRASLSVGRLAEGHMNALRLIGLYGSPEQRRRHFVAAAAGLIYGVWGAEGTPPVGLNKRLEGRVRLSGQKRFASGLGTLGRAVVTVSTEEGTRLVIVETTDPARADATDWQVSGMRATASGTYDFDGAEGELLGGPDDYEREPFFQGGVWRYAAVHVGGLEALAEAVRTDAATKGKAATEAQLHRVARMATLAHAARLLVEDAALKVEARGAGIEAVALSLAAREAVEQACLEGMAITDRALGTRSFATDSPVERIRRDLGLFLRQADLDGKLALVGGSLCSSDLPVGELWSDL